MKVSIITSCFNRETTIRNAIESVLSQDYADIEYIIIDGASTDRSLDIINEYKDRVDKIVSEPDGGMYEAINKGIRLATGEIIGLVHSDDVLYDEHTISDVVRKVEETNAEFLYADGIYYNDYGKPIRKWIGGKYSRIKTKLAWLPLHTTTYIKKDVYEKYGLYNESYKIAADTDLLIRLLHDNDIRVTYLKKYVVKMLMGGASTDPIKRKKMLLEDLKILKEHDLRPAWLFKTFKISWKIPQYIRAYFSR